MTELTTEQTIYLLYAKAYTEAGTVTKGTIKSCLPKEWKDMAEEVYSALKTQDLINLATKEGKLTKREGRFSVTEQGKRVLITNLATTNYEFTSSKGYKVLNTLLACIKELAEAYPQGKLSEEMKFDEFQDKFAALYFEERKRQELGGVVAIHKKELLSKFQNTNSRNLSPEALDKYFEDLKSTGIVFVSKGEKDDLIHWVE